MEYFLVGWVIFFWGLWGFFSKLSTQKIGLQVMIWNQLISVILIIIFLLLRHELPPKIDLLGIIFGLLAGLTITLGSIAFYSLLDKYPAGFLVTITSLYPAVTVLLSLIFLREKLDTPRIVGIILAFASLIFLHL